VQFHGGNRRGYDGCLMCHGTSGAEDRARHLAGNAPATPGTSIEFRSMLHKIHAGSLLTQQYDVVGQSSAMWPDNYSVHNYNGIGFPALPGGVANCASCHGAGNTAWHAPAERVHPQQTKPARTWFAACITCHDSNAARAHAEANTSPNGAEACAICHGPGEEQHVVLEHKTR
jgi:OmcA/MtrC family decaheme c-type cytochrome